MTEENKSDNQEPTAIADLNAKVFTVGEILNYFGVLVDGSVDNLDEFWKFECPCGVVVRYGINKIPLATTPHPCGNPKHFSVKIKPTDF